MYLVSVRRHFDAAHALRGYGGKCERFHGHRFEVVAHVTASQLDRLGMAYDFRALKKDLDAIIDRLDHTNLNEIPPFDEINPSSENIARFIYDELKKSLKVRLESVEVWESPDAWVTYRG
jgi:6-pyruvoyltetrahydropterin/6-carboxytetrahydropterin synthase